MPTIRWMINTGNKRREDAQALMIPDLATKGFKVVADNADDATVFQKRLPALDYDLAMYVGTVTPDPTVTAVAACDRIPSAANNHQGQNFTGWCNQAATALMRQSDRELDETKRIEDIRKIGQYLVDDSVLLPLYQFSNVAAWRSDELGGPVGADASSYRGVFNNLNQWEPIGGTDIVIGAEQWPGCINPVTACANLLWEVWTSGYMLFPGVWDTTAAGYAPTALVIGEPELTFDG